MNKRDFINRYQSYSNVDLLKIVNSPDDYQVPAVEAANDLLADRNVSEADISVAQGHIIKQKHTSDKDHWEKAGKSLLRKIYPSHKNLTEKIIAACTLILCFIVLNEWYNQFDLLMFIFSDEIVNWDFSLMILLPFFLLPVATWWFYKRRKIGWTMVVIYLIFLIIAGVSMLLYDLNREPVTSLSMEIVAPQIDMVNCIISTLFFSLFLLSICRADVREIYAVEKRYMFITASATAVVALMGISAFLMMI